MLLALSGEFAKRRGRTGGPRIFSSCTSSSTIWQNQFKTQEKKKKILMILVLCFFLAKVIIHSEREYFTLK